MKKFLVILLLGVIANKAYSQSGTIRELIGEVELKPAGASEFTPAQQGNIVARDTLVSTGFRSTAVIEVGSTIITVRPLTRLSLADIQSSVSEENLKVNLQTGRIRVDVKPPAGLRASTTVQSPTATASVRGTSFEVDAMNLTVIEGKVIYQGSSGFTVPVSAGSASVVDIEGTPISPIEIAEAELMPASPVDSSLTTGEMAASGISNTLDLDVGIEWK